LKQLCKQIQILPLLIVYARLLVASDCVAVMVFNASREAFPLDKNARQRLVST